MTDVKTGAEAPHGSIPTAELDSRFSYHEPSSDMQVWAIEDIRRDARILADLINTTVPHCREKATALTKLEEVVFWANAGVARHST